MSGDYKHQKNYRKKLLTQPVPEGQKRCRRCLQVRSAGEFVNVCGRTPDGNSKNCASCRDYLRKFNTDQRASRTEEEHQRILGRAKKLRDDRKRLVINHYGGKCACCGISEIEFLTMDHIVKIGAKKRKENGDWGNRFYLNIIRRNFPPDYRCLCWNCNWAFGCYGFCPHQREPKLVDLLTLIDKATAPGHLI